MGTGDVIAIASFALSLMAVVFVIGKNAQRLEVVEKDLNKLGEKVERDFLEAERRLDKQATFVTRIDQRIVNIEGRVFSEETAARMRE